MLRWFLYDDSPTNARGESQTTEEAKEPQGASGSGAIGTGGAELKPEIDDLDPAVTAAILAQVSEVTNVCGFMLVSLIDRPLKTRLRTHSLHTAGTPCYAANPLGALLIQEKPSSPQPNTIKVFRVL